MTLPRWAREPLVHFLAAGFVVFVVLTWENSGNVDPTSRVISVDRTDQAQIALQFERTMGRAPTDAELATAVQRFVRDEVLYREALRLGLDQGDAVVRRRLVAKMDQSASVAAEAAEPSDAALRKFYDENRGRYAGGRVISLDQLYFDKEQTARGALQKVSSDSDWSTMGEATSLPSTFDNLSDREVNVRLGEEFAAGLKQLEPGDEWRGPIRSGFGWHLVRLRARGPGEPIPFEDVRNQVVNDWRSAEIAARKERSFEILRDAYRIEIDK